MENQRVRRLPAWTADRLTRACAELGTHLTDEGDRLAVGRPRAS